MLGRGVGRVDVGEHLDLVELVHPQDAAGVLAVGAGLLAEAGRPPGVPQRQAVGVEHLVHVERRERHLRGAHEVEVLLGQVVDVLGRLGEEAGALHRLRLDQHRRYDGHEPGLERLGHRQVEHRELQLGADAGQVVEPGAARPSRRARCRWRRAAGRARGGPAARSRTRGGCADVLEHHVVVLAALGHARLGDVGQPAHQRRRTSAPASACVGVGGLDLGRQLPWCGPAGRPSRRPSPWPPGGRGPSARPRARSKVTIAARRALVGGQHLVDQARVLAAGALRGADGLGVVSQQLEVQHPASVSSRPAGRRATTVRAGTMPGRSDGTCGRRRVPAGGERGTTARVRNVLYRPPRTSGPPAGAQDTGWPGRLRAGRRRGRAGRDPVHVAPAARRVGVGAAGEPRPLRRRLLNRSPAATARWCTRWTSARVGLDPWVFRAGGARGGGLAVAPRREAAGRLGRGDRW